MINHMNYFKTLRANNVAGLICEHLNQGDSVIDIGAGDCFLSKTIRDQRNVEITAVDKDDYSKTNIKPIIYDGHTLPFPDNSFDVAIFSFVLHYVENKDSLLLEAARVTRDKIIIISDVFETRFGKAVAAGWGYFANIGRASDKTLPLGISSVELRKLAIKTEMDIIADDEFQSLFSFFIVKHKLLVLERADSPNTIIC